MPVVGDILDVLAVDDEPERRSSGCSRRSCQRRASSSPGRSYWGAIWGESAYREPRGLDLHIRHLREKLEERPDAPQLILTVRGVGYRLRDDAPPGSAARPARTVSSPARYAPRAARG